MKSSSFGCATAYAFSNHFAVIQRELSSSVSEALGLPPSAATLSLAFDEDGISGTLDPNDGCGFAAFPANARCPEWSNIEVDLDRERDGFRPRDALAAVDELGDVPLRWSDGSETTVSISIADSPGWACSGDFAASLCPERLSLPVSVRAMTVDGRLDAQLPAELTVEVATEASATQSSCGLSRPAGDIVSLSVTAWYLPGAALGADVVPPLAPDAGFSLQLSRRPEAPDPPIAQFTPVALQRRDPGLGPPIDATTDEARASCFVTTGVAAGGSGALSP